MAKKDNKEKSKKDRTRLNLILLAILVVLILAGYFYMKHTASSAENFEYRGIDFKIDAEDPERTLYKTTFNINREINGSYTDVRTTFVFINDPRKLHGFFEKASYFLGLSPTENIDFIKENKTYVSYNDPLPNCNDSFAAAFGLGSFLVLYGMDVKGATANPAEERENAPFIDCKNSTNNTVIIVKNGKYTGFEKLSDNCYEISFRKCGILEAAEKFELAVLESDFGKK